MDYICAGTATDSGDCLKVIFEKDEFHLLKRSTNSKYNLSNNKNLTVTFPEKKNTDKKNHHNASFGDSDFLQWSLRLDFY